MSWPVAPERNFENDLEDSPFLWPQEITSFGTPYTWINGKQLEEKFQTKKIGTYSLKEKNEYVIVIYK